MKNLAKTKLFIYGTYLLILLATLLIGFVLSQSNIKFNGIVKAFFNVTENRTFDYRQRIRVSHKRPMVNSDIVVLAIDDASLEYLWDKYGEWPIPRNIYADLINYIEAENPKSIIFDLMFIKSVRTSQEADKALIEAMNKYPNVYTGMNFDGQEFDVRKPIDLPSRISVNLQNNSKIKLADKYKYLNCRPILEELLDGTVSVGLTNAQRHDDGIIRTIAPLVQYKGKFYPYLAFKASADYLGASEKLTIDKNGTMKIGYTNIPFTKQGDVILNWYGKSKTHTVIPLYKIINEMNTNNDNITKFNFKNKIVVIGTTAMSLQDNKSVPVEDGVYPGVEVLATFFNNMLDNNFIHKSSILINLCIVTIVLLLVGAIVMLSTSTIFATLSTLLFAIAYLFISYYVMELYNIWIPVVMPIIAIIGAFTLSILAKYLMKARDFEYQYKLATIDGLTELYNHRYFQDTLRKQLDISQRYNQPFSLIIADIDFFKNFNDKYGHQAGDAVLRQVAQLLKNNSRTTDYVCRYGGEEMSIILPNTGAEEALLLANRICNAVSQTPFKLTPVDTVTVTISVGVSTFPDNAQTPQDIIEWADKGLYYAKEHGRNQVGRY